MDTITRYKGFEDLLRRQARERRAAPALLFEQDGKKTALSYGELLTSVEKRSMELAAKGITCLGVLCDGSAACVITIFGSVFAGMQTVLLDANGSDQLLREQIAYTDVDMLWGDPELLEELDDVIEPSKEKSGACGPGQMLFFTSGTTSACKAVVLTDASLMASAFNGSSMLALSERDTLLCMLPLCHVFGFVCSLLWGLACGAGVALGRGMRAFADDPAFFRPTAVSLVPMLLGFLLKQRALNPELEKILVGAGDCPPALLQAVQARGIHVSFGYGLTETSSGVAISTSGDPYALDICPDDTITLAEDGEIMIQAPTCMMKGYYKMPEETAQVLRGGVLATGDLGRFDSDGRLHIIGRKKEILVLPDGTKIFLPEYEAGIYRALAKAAGTSDMDMAVAEKDHAPVLVICAAGLGREEILRILSPVMAVYPRGQQLKDVIIADSPLPRTTTGKVKRWELAEII